MAKPLLRFAMVEFGEAIKRSKEYRDGVEGGSPVGLFEGMMESLESLFRKTFNTTWIWVPWLERGDFYGRQKQDGKWTGIVGLFQREEVDVFPMPLPLVHEAINQEIIVEGPVVMSSPVIIGSVFKGHNTTVQVLDQWFNYSLDLIILFLITMFILVKLLIKMSQSSKSFVKNLFDLISMIFYQSFPHHGNFHSTIMVTIVAVGIFFWMNIWSNMVSTDMVVADDRYVIRSVDDMIRLGGIKSMMFGNDPAYNLVRDRAVLEPGSNWNKVFKQCFVFSGSTATKSDKVKLTSHLAKLVGGGHIMITIEEVIALSEVFFCTMNRDSIILIAKEKSMIAPFNVWFQPQMEMITEKKVTRMFRLINEAGTISPVMATMEHIFNDPIVEKRRCFESNIDLFMQSQSIPDVFDENAIPPISISMMDQVFYLLIGGLILPGVVLLFEKTLHKLYLEARQRTEQKIHKFPL